jgi:NADPH:quinone reductase-like Zn-dependent oxidoreductase
MMRDSWDLYLSSTGFTGLDLAFPAHEKIVKCSAMVSTVVDLPRPITQAPKAVILVHTDIPIQFQAATQLQLLLKDVFPTCNILSIEDIKNTVGDQTICLSLLEIHKPLFHHITELEFEAIKDLFSRFETVIWASSENSSNANPISDMTTGLARTIREEMGTLKLVTVKLQMVQDLSRSLTQLSKIVRRAINPSLDDQEVEFAEVNGAFCNARLVAHNSLNDFVARKTISQVAEIRKLRDDSSESIKLAIKQPGMLDSFQYEVDNSISARPIGVDEIELEVKAAGLNFRDVLIALGREPACYLGMECSGVVTKVGSNAAAKFNIGDRVTCMIDGSFRTIARCIYHVAIKIPDDMSFQSAAAFPIAFCSAYYALMHMGRMKPKESILIHSGAGAFGQACIQLAKLLDAKIFTTVGSDDKKEFLVNTFQIPEENIFSSRSPDFVHGIKTLTNGRGVDVIVNSLAGEALKCSWDCIAPFGRFVEAGKKDIYNFGKLSMFPFSRNATFSSIDMVYNYRNAPEIIGELMESAMTLIKDGKISLANPIHVYNSSQVETAFRYLESGKSKGKLVIEFNDDDVLPVSH